MLVSIFQVWIKDVKFYDLLPWKESFHEARNLYKDGSPNIFEIFGKYVNEPIIFFFHILSPGVMFTCLSLEGKGEVLKLWRIKSEKTTVIYLMVFVGMSVSWLALDESKLKISFNFCSLYLHVTRKKRDSCSLWYIFPILSMLVLFLFLQWI